MPTVLIADDHAGVRMLLRVVLEDDFDIVFEAADGRQAVAGASLTEPDYAVLDLDMPVMDGAEAAELIRALCPNTVIVSFSASLFEEPSWSDAHVDKDDIVSLPDVLASFAASARAIA